jgi:hypothetical protein
MGVNELLAVDGTHFLALERDGKGGDEAAHKLLFLIDTAGATDVSAVAALPERQLEGDIKPVTKKLFLDLLDSRLGLKGKDFPKKIEGLAFGPGLPDGRRTLVVTTDNDFDDDLPTYVWVFAFDPSDLGAANKPGGK